MYPCTSKQPAVASINYLAPDPILFIRLIRGLTLPFFVFFIVHYYGITLALYVLFGSHDSPIFGRSERRPESPVRSVWILLPGLVWSAGFGCYRGLCGSGCDSHKSATLYLVFWSVVGYCMFVVQERSYGQSVDASEDCRKE
jgi:hypothetical protein